MLLWACSTVKTLKTLSLNQVTLYCRPSIEYLMYLMLIVVVYTEKKQVCNMLKNNNPAFNNCKIKLTAETFNVCF